MLFRTVSNILYVIRIKSFSRSFELTELIYRIITYKIGYIVHVRNVFDYSKERVAVRTALLNFFPTSRFVFFIAVSTYRLCLFSRKSAVNRERVKRGAAP